MKVWRWLRGGHWERWYVGDFGRLWFRLPGCSHDTGVRPHAACHGRPICENHPDSERRAIACALVVGAIFAIVFAITLVIES